MFKMATATKVDLVNTPKFDGTNFQLFKFSIQILLKSEKLLSVVTGAEKEPEDKSSTEWAAWDSKNTRAQGSVQQPGAGAPGGSAAAAPGQAPAGSYQQPYGAYQPPAGYYGGQPQAPVPGGGVPQGGYGFPAYGYGGQQGGAPSNSQDN